MHAHIKLFDGTYKDQNPRDFLKAVMLDFESSYGDKEKIQRFELRLKSDSDAEAWFDGLDPPKKATWEALRAAFEERWPKEAGPTLSLTEMTLRIASLAPDLQQLGQYVDVDDHDVPYHKAWIDDVVRRMRKSNVPGNMAALVRETLPADIRGEVDANINDWDTLVTQVTKITTTYIREKLEKTRELDAKMKMLETRTEQRLQAIQRTAPPQSPTAPLRQGLRRLNFQSTSTVPSAPRTQAAAPDGNGNPFITRAPPAPGSLFARQRPGWAAPGVPDAIIQMQASTWPPQSTTPDGLKVYKEQVRSFEQLGEPTYDGTPTPLTPGTMPLGSRECFRCAKHVHGGRAYCSDAYISRYEARWRRWVGRRTHGGGQQDMERIPAAAVNLIQDAYYGREVGPEDIHEDTEGNRWLWCGRSTTSEQSEEGKGSGSSD